MAARHEGGNKEENKDEDKGDEEKEEETNAVDVCFDLISQEDNSYLWCSFYTGSNED